MECRTSKYYKNFRKLFETKTNISDDSSNNGGVRDDKRKTRIYLHEMKVIRAKLTGLKY